MGFFLREGLFSLLRLANDPTSEKGFLRENKVVFSLIFEGQLNGSIRY